MRPRIHGYAGNEGLARSFGPTAVLAACLTAITLAACSVSMPISPFGKGSDDITGSIGGMNKSNPLSRALDNEDWRRAKAALSTALDPQGNGETVNWDNPQTGAKGSFVAVAQAYPSDDGVCRAFITNISAREASESLQGTACRDKLGEWSLSNVRPWKRSTTAS